MSLHNGIESLVMEPNVFIDWIKTQGPFVVLAALILYWSRQGVWVWKREYDNGIAAKQRECDLLQTQVNDWKGKFAQYEAMVLASIEATRDTVKTVAPLIKSTVQP